MTSITVPLNYASIDTQPRAAWPWITSLVLLACFGAACWTWDAHTWYSTSESDVNALVGRISEGQIGRQLGMLGMGVYGLALLAMPAANDRRFSIKPVLFYTLALFVVWAFISAAWSFDRPQSIKRLVVFAAMCVTVAAVIKHYDMRQMAQIALITSVVTLLVGIGNEIYTILTMFPGIGKYRFGGTMHPNHGALNCSVVILSSLYLFRLKKNWWLIALVVFAGGILVLTKSRTALMACMSGVAVFWLLATTTKRAVMALLVCGWIAGGMMWLNSMQMLPSFKSVIAMGREDLKKQDPRELTGRTAIWTFALMQADKDPNRTLIGYGYESFWTPENARGVSDVVKFKISEGHNVYLDWYLELGLVGAALYVTIVLSAFVRWTAAAKMLSSPSCAIAAGIIAMAIVHGFAESSSGDASLPTLFFYTSLAMSTLARPDEMEADHA